MVPPRIKAVLSGGGTSEDDADAVDTGTTVAITTSTATPIDTLIRVAVRRRFLTRSAIGLKPDNCGSSRRPRCTLRRGEFVVCSPFLHQRPTWTGIGGRYRIAAQEISRPVPASFQVFAMEDIPE